MIARPNARESDDETGEKGKFRFYPMEKITDGLKQTTQAFSSMASWGLFSSTFDDIVLI
jgi:hypothetical protein